ncbi:hypothetical protein T11_17782 [Trichinella zimbabwensis]|uniref:Uncharacterized protein n=1 Tax=Trichinella zimbabwensis TaxID=268475 RepID=A0A0V1HH81_9BILA|nr:hypothetical protein T11_17782 [Trichinella zimbabwensis]
MPNICTAILHLADGQQARPTANDQQKAPPRMAISIDNSGNSSAPQESTIQQFTSSSALLNDDEQLNSLGPAAWQEEQHSQTSWIISSDVCPGGREQHQPFEINITLPLGLFLRLVLGHAKEEQSFITIHDLFETFSPCKSIDTTSLDTTEVETEEQRPVSG